MFPAPVELKLCINAALKTKEDHYGTNYGTVAFKS